jgi:hypothetical protein
MGGARQQRMQEALLPYQLKKYMGPTTEEISAEAKAKRVGTLEAERGAPQKPTILQLGNRQLAVDPYTLQERGEFDVGVSPTAEYSAEEAMERARYSAGEAAARQRAGFGQQRSIAEYQAGQASARQRAGFEAAERRLGAKAPKAPKGPPGWSLTRSQASDYMAELMGENEAFMALDEDARSKLHRRLVDQIPKFAKKSGLSEVDAANEVFRQEASRFAGGQYSPKVPSTAELAASPVSAVPQPADILPPRVSERLNVIAEAIRNKTFTQERADTEFQQIYESLDERQRRALDRYLESGGKF